MNTSLTGLLQSVELTPALAEDDAVHVAGTLGALAGMEVYPRSIAAARRALFWLGKRGNEKFVACLSADSGVPARVGGPSSTQAVDGGSATLAVAPVNADAAAGLRGFLPYLVAGPLGLQKSAGCGDRLGLATPGHIRAFRSTFGPQAASRMAPIFAQQSIRENARTGRTPQEVMDDALWGVFQEGWRDGFGADADHLKTTEDVDVCAAAGYTFYTVDPGAHVDDTANTAPLAELERKAGALPWDVLDSRPSDLEQRLVGKTIDLGAFSFTFSRADLLRAAAKYGHAVAHTVRMYRHLGAVMGDRPWELEMSVDETETVTSLAEHVYIAAELQRLGVRCVSLAPRYVGTFEKGVDYIGDLAAFERSITQHMAVSRAFGPYKLSLHSGSDKFSVYPISARVAGELVHLKTAGTSYLEALRAIAAMDPPLFRQIMDFAVERYPTDRASYHVSAQLTKVPAYAAMADGELPTLLDDFHAREVLHVTFGSVLNHAPFRQPFFAALRSHEETYTRMVEVHFNKHFTPFSGSH